MRFKGILFHSLMAFLTGASTASADSGIEANARAGMIVGGGHYSPFWLISNRYGTLSTNKNQSYVRADIRYSHAFSDHFQLSADMDGIASVHTDRTAYLQQLYLSLRFRSLTLSIGSMERYDGVLNPELSSGDMAHSINAAPIPEINLCMKDFQSVPFTNHWVRIKGDFAIGRSFDANYLEKNITMVHRPYNTDILWHHKSLYLQIGRKERFPLLLTLGLQHWAEWGGTSTADYIGKQPSGFKDMIKVVMGSEGGSGSTAADAINVLGNHYGTYDLKLSHETERMSLSLYHQHYFDDKSGMAFVNGLDGLWGGEIAFKDKQFLPTILMEYLTTRNQSGPLHFIEYDHSKYEGPGGGCDNYYNNGEYATGVSYYQRTMGNPLLPSPAYYGSLGFRHNRVRAYHIAIKGNITQQLSYIGHYSYTKSWGMHELPLLSPQDTHALGMRLSYDLLDSPWSIEAGIGYDKGTLLRANFGVEFTVNYHIKQMIHKKRKR